MKQILSKVFGKFGKFHYGAIIVLIGFVVFIMYSDKLPF